MAPMVERAVSTASWQLEGEVRSVGKRWHLPLYCSTFFFVVWASSSSCGRYACSPGSAWMRFHGVK